MATNEPIAGPSETVRDVRSINDIPEIVLEYILSFLSPYKDILECRLVCKHWRPIADSALEKLDRDYNSAIASSKLQWTNFKPTPGHAISGRYSHSTCRVGQFIYIFGGCTLANTTFNDLWMFDLSNRTWLRPVASGTYPPPKSCASLVSYNQSLILFGGWAYASISPMHQGWKMFNHLHEYNRATNRWSVIETTNECPSLSGHSACIMGDQMIVFGGLTAEANNAISYQPTNAFWILDLKTLTWSNQLTLVPKPPPRYGHSHVVLESNKHILILGGCGGPNMLLNDVWLLTVLDGPTPTWFWRQIIVKAKDTGSQPTLHFHQACKINNKIVILNKSPLVRLISRKKNNCILFQGKSNIEKEAKELGEAKDALSEPGPSSSSFDLPTQPDICTNRPSIRPNARCNRQKLLEGLNRMERRIISLNRTSLPTAQAAHQQADLPLMSRSSMAIHVMDLTHLLTQGFVWWHTSADDPTDGLVGPEDVILYTLTEGKNEIIMFGGIKRDSNSRFNHPGDSTTAAVFNDVHIISAKRFVI